jgi:hypothetical protein
VVDLGDIPDFPGLPGQRPTPGDPATVSPVEVVLVTCGLDREYRNVALNSAAVDAFIEAEIAAERAQVIQVERWSPWSDLQVQIGIGAASQLNYARFTIDGRSWYGFLSGDYLNLTDTVYTVTPDVWTTYGPTIGYSMVRRGHVAVAASSTGNVGYCLEPEDFTPGDLIGYASYRPDPLGSPRVLVISTTDLRADPFVNVDDDVADTMSDPISQTLATGSIEAPQPVGGDEGFSYIVGNGDYEDLFYYPYSEGSGAVMRRPRAVGATPSLVDGVIAEGGAFVYASVGAAITHLSRLAHAPWIADGIQRVLLVPGGSSASNGATNLSPTSTIGSFAGAPTYVSSFTTEIGYDVTLTGDWKGPLPGAYDIWTKLRTGPYSAIEIADRLGGASEIDPQYITGLNDLVLHFEGVFYPQADVASWIVGAGGTAAPADPTHSPVGADMAHYAVGRDSALASQAAGLSAERSQSIYDMLLAMQRGNADTAYTRSSAFTASQFAIAEAI